MGKMIFVLILIGDIFIAWGAYQYGYQRGLRAKNGQNDGAKK